MTEIKQDSLATLGFELRWTSDVAKHREFYFAQQVNFWRDLFPGKVYQALMGNKIGDQVDLSFQAGEITLPYESKQIFTLHPRQFERRRVKGYPVEPRYGRFYPKGLLKGLSNIFSNNLEPFRCVGVEPEHLTVDLNHPLAVKENELQITVYDVTQKETDRGGRLTDWMEVITSGPGMQARSNGRATDFFSDSPLARADEQSDLLFYEKPRFVTHIDSKAQEIIRGLYAGLLRPGMKVLDLMSSWRSHVHESLKLASLVGLGLNKEEMEDNPQLTGYVIHDLNSDPRLPFDDHTFDTVICTVSVEYMVRPFSVFSDVARLLKPGGYFIHTFSNRWFPPKAISIWEELNDFERMGLVLEYYLQTGRYDNLETYSARGWSRPVTDRHYPEILTADPVFAVCGQTAK
jgi:SAM-dependent methyltransferase